MSRNSGILGIRHRRKQTAEGEARPTQVAIKTAFGALLEYNLEDDTAELDFLMGRFPVEWRDVWTDDDITAFRRINASGAWSESRRGHRHEPGHICAGSQQAGNARYRSSAPRFPSSLTASSPATKWEWSWAVRAIGLLRRFPSAASRLAPRCFGFLLFLAMIRDTKDKDDDPKTLVNMVENSFHLFYQVRQRDRELISVKEALSARMDAMKARIACEQRIQQSLVGNIFLNPEGHFPEGVIEAQFDDAKANDKILQALISKRVALDKELAQAVECVEIWNRFSNPSKVSGPVCGRHHCTHWRHSPVYGAARFFGLPHAGGSSEGSQ